MCRLCTRTKVIEYLKEQEKEAHASCNTWNGQKRKLSHFLYHDSIIQAINRLYRNMACTGISQKRSSFIFSQYELYVCLLESAFLKFFISLTAKILPVVKNQHLLLCTLLIGNSLAMEVCVTFTYLVVVLLLLRVLTYLITFLLSLYSLFLYSWTSLYLHGQQYWCL